MLRPSDSVEARAALVLLFSHAVPAYAVDNQQVASYPKLVLATDRVSDSLKIFAVKLDQSITSLTVQVVMLWIAVVMLVNGPTPEFHFA